MNTEMTIHQEPAGKIVSTPSSCFTYQVRESWESEDRGNENYFTWPSPVLIADSDGVEMLPYGFRNDIPQLLRDTVYNNPAAPTIMEKNQQLLWGQGPHLYRDALIDGKPGREWAFDDDIQEWLESFDYKNYLFKGIVDHSFMRGSFHQIILARSGRLGKNRIHSLEHINPLWARLGRKIDSAVPTHCYVSDLWTAFGPDMYKMYPLFDVKDPYKNGRSVHYSRQYSFATDFYAIPPIYGALEWIRRDTAIPLILKALSKFSMNAKYHVTSPAKFWDEKREQLQAECQSRNEPYTESMLDDYETLIFQSIIKTLSGEGNAGKLWHTKNIMVGDGINLTEQGWEIKPIDQNIKEFVDTQIAISNKASAVVSSAVGVHKALAGTTEQGKADSGSEQLYAYLMYKLTGIKIPEMIVTEVLNWALALNFPEKKLKIGFFHEEAQRQQDQSSQDRIKNNPQ